MITVERSSDQWTDRGQLFQRTHSKVLTGNGVMFTITRYDYPPFSGSPEGAPRRIMIKVTRYDRWGRAMDAHFFASYKN